MNCGLSKLLVAFLAFPMIMTAQPRHCKGLDMIGAGFGTGSHQKTYFLSYQRYMANNLSLKGNLEYTRVPFAVSSYSSFAVVPEGHFTLFSNYRNLYLNAKAGGTIGFETIRNEAFGNRQGTFFGQSLGAGVEFFFSHRLKSELGVEQRFIQKSLVTKYYTLYQLSVYLSFN